MKYPLFILAFLLGVQCLAQDVPADMQQQLENIAEINEADPDDDNMLQQLDYFRKHPINVNTATAGELQTLKMLTDLQIGSLLRYRQLLGNLISIYELQAVPTWDLSTITKVFPYLTVSNAASINDNFLSRFRRGDQSFLFRATRILEKAKGFNASSGTHYLGDRNHLMLRYRYQYKDLLYCGFTGDKDAGEQFFKGAQSRGFDFYSFHFFARRLGIIKSVAIGDYTANLGQGLIQWQSLSFGKSSEVMLIKRQLPVLVPYRSAGEFYFNRGAGITVQKKNIEATVFASYKKVSVNIETDSIRHFTSLLTSGYYRTPSEIADRNKITLTSLGGNINYQNNFLKVGFNTIAHSFEIPFYKRDEPYNLYAINGKRTFNSSIDYSYTYKNMHLFGEAAIDNHFHQAIVSGALVSVDPKVDFSVLYRNIQKQYQVLFGNAFTENSVPVNERGLYAGITVRPNSVLKLNVYADFFQFPWIKYLVNAPTRGYDYLIQMDYQPDKQFGMYVRFRNKNKPGNRAGNGVINYPENQIKQSLRVHFSKRISPAFSVIGRSEMLWLNKKSNSAEQAFLGLVEARYNGRRMSANLRIQFFETDTYNSRIYVYESDVLYSFSIPAYYDTGVRYYANVQFDLGRKMRCWLRYGQTLYSNRSLIGSGLDEIVGNKKSEIKMQMLYHF